MPIFLYSIVLPLSSIVASSGFISTFISFPSLFKVSVSLSFLELIIIFLNSKNNNGFLPLYEIISSFSCIPAIYAGELASILSILKSVKPLCIFTIRKATTANSIFIKAPANITTSLLYALALSKLLSSALSSSSPSMAQ